MGNEILTTEALLEDQSSAIYGVKSRELASRLDCKMFKKVPNKGQPFLTDGC